MRLLVVEDNELNRRLVRAVLTPRGHALEEAHNAPDSIAALDRDPPPDVVLLDITIPGGGLTVAEHVRSRPALRAVTVIAITALAVQGDEQRFLSAGCHGYIAKPIDIRTFAQEIEAIVRRHRAKP